MACGRGRRRAPSIGVNVCPSLLHGVRDRGAAIMATPRSTAGSSDACSTAPPAHPRRRPRRRPRTAGRAALFRRAAGATVAGRLQAVSLFPQPRDAAGVLAAPVRRHAAGARANSRATGRWCSSVSPTAPTSARPRWPSWRRRRSSGQPLPDGARPRVLFVSVDPERDTPDRIGEYAHAFHRDTLAATADVPALEDFAQVAVAGVHEGGPRRTARPPTSTASTTRAAMAVLDPQGRMAGRDPAAARAEGDRGGPDSVDADKA